MPNVPGGTILTPIVMGAAAVCKPVLLSREDLFLLYAEFFFPYDINPAAFGHLYGVYDGSAGESAPMCMSIDDRQNMLRCLWLSYQRMAASMRYYALPTYIGGERFTSNGSSAIHLYRGHVTNVGERSCNDVALAVPLTEDGDGTWIAQVTMPSGVSIDDLVVYESGVRDARVPVVNRSLSGTTATLRFYRETLVSALFWAECGAARTSCDCSVNSATDHDAFMEYVDVYALTPVRATGLHLTRDCSCRPRTTTACGSVEDPVLGWVRSENGAPCSCQPAGSAYGSAYYTSGRWTRETMPEDVREAMFGMAISLMPETSLCGEATRPLHFTQYREAAPTDAPGGMRAWGQVLARGVVRSYANGSGI